MSFLNRFRSPEERERREREKAEREQRQRDEEVARSLARAEAAQVEAERQAAAARAAQRAAFTDAVGVELAEMDVNTPAEAKLAIKLARLRKKELQSEKREISADLADHREGWRERQAGRHSTVGLGRGTGGRIVRAGIQAKRRSERQANANVVNAFSDAKQEIDRKIAIVDRLIIDLERQAAGR